ncbi:MAG: glucokinase [Pseudomonadales bacterium]|nr:glucokinase [Pseudomonadales bacterium]
MHFSSGQTYSIVADVGGTNTRIALTCRSVLQEFSIQHFSNDDFQSFQQLLTCYTKGWPLVNIDSVCIALAAPVTGQQARLTNRNWLIDTFSIQQLLGCEKVQLINDFEALALSLNEINDADLQPISAAQTKAGGGKKMVLGAGTGFNGAQLLDNNLSGVARVSCAECGHMTLPVESLEEMRLRNYLAGFYHRASIERVLSGQGLVNLYQWLGTDKNITTDDLSPAQIAAAACSDDDPLCREAGELFSRFFARVVGDMALAFLPYGGIYLSGGVSRGLAQLLKQPAFIDTFHAKGRQSELMKSFNIQLITSDNSALLGCAAAL